ncbi:MAG: hypothetical protein HN712_26470 [Gemmatimonadetes bacterium]|jgi:hypothetical protein|nr:hypothetical protein [Gemmatimonadota bacterium]MBT6148180.1 hypothetical protein [Gemmatimonadota bacterium]MBT7863887.1 hypothetical protein [Gemmatimonadota bacterium]
MATVDINAAAASNPSASPRERAQQHLGRLVASLEAVASRIDANDTSQTERTVLRTRFHDLQRQVNRLDGIVAGEGLEARGQFRANQSADPGSAASAPARSRTDQDRVEIAQANVEAAAPPAAPSAPEAGTDGVDLVV